MSFFVYTDFKVSSVRTSASYAPTSKDALGAAFSRSPWLQKSLRSNIFFVRYESGAKARQVKRQHLRLAAPAWPVSSSAADRFYDWPRPFPNGDEPRLCLGAAIASSQSVLPEGSLHLDTSQDESLLMRGAHCFMSTELGTMPCKLPPWAWPLLPLCLG